MGFRASLLAAGLICSDDYDNVRAVVNKKLKLNKYSSMRNNSGRWSLLLLNYCDDEIKRDEACARLLLLRYDIVFRELLARERKMPSWGRLLRAFRNLEDRGQIRGGLFVKIFSGEKFANNYAVESLRACKHVNQRYCFVCY